LTLTCKASGDPHPHITWTKDGVPGSQFNASGYLLHLVKVQKKDAGSYICTASNGYGDDATSVSVVNVKCEEGFISIYFKLLRLLTAVYFSVVILILGAISPSQKHKFLEVWTLGPSNYSLLYLTATRVLAFVTLQYIETNFVTHVMIELEYWM